MIVNITIVEAPRNDMSLAQSEVLKLKRTVQHSGKVGVESYFEVEFGSEGHKRGFVRV